MKPLTRTSLLRTGSVPVLPPGFRISSFSSQAADNISRHSPTISLNLHSRGRQRDTPPRTINRALSENDVMRSTTDNFGVSRKLNRSGTGEEYLSDGQWLEVSGFGGGSGDRCDRGIATVTGGNDGDRIKIGGYYREMLKSNPTDALLLGNYGKFLYEVEKDSVRAEEYYGRAILANPGDGELLSQYGKLIWETERDEGRAKSYFDQALYAAPDDWYCFFPFSPSP
ncbi:TPR domain protein [Senna tora]|uniref:TPR domain protein n=1 Tax=Senna tora TaxID=362788 RepID=A0A834STL0_9FABA|nr:TPR domain protein [Senna tora]